MHRPLILLIEDNPGDVALVHQAFAECALDATLVHADNAVKAFNYLRDCGGTPTNRLHEMRLPDLVLLDLNLPVIDGKKVLEVFKEDPHWRTIAVIVLTSSALEKDRVECEALGAAGFMVKPTVWPGFVEFGKAMRDRLDDIRVKSRVAAKD